jgi:hypothetical protein
MTRLSSMLLALVLAAAWTGPTAAAQSPGGHLDVLSIGDVDSLDPGFWYSQYDYMALGQTTPRWLYAWEPGKTTPTPDVAAALPQTSADGKTVTIRIRPASATRARTTGSTSCSTERGTQAEAARNSSWMCFGPNGHSRSARAQPRNASRPAARITSENTIGVWPDDVYT